MTTTELEKAIENLLNQFIEINKIEIEDIEILEPISDRGFKVKIKTTN